MGRGKSKGGTGAQATYNVSPLTAFRENARQFNEAIAEAKKQGASVVEFTTITGETKKRYWNGVTFTDRRSSLYVSSDPKYKRKGTYKAKFKPPKSWE